MKDLATVTVEDFAPAVGDVFRVVAGPEGRYADPPALTLDAAEGRGTAPDPLRDPFRLAFSGPADPALAQATYLLEHEALGELPVFLVPYARDAQTARYEAIFA